MNVLDLFSGIGGFSLGLERAGMKTVAFCEIDENCQKVLRKHWPDTPISKDVERMRYFKGVLYFIGKNEAGKYVIKNKIYEGNIDVICGGFPCQDISVAGKGKGFRDELGKTTRSGLWKEFKRLIKEIKPRYAIIENVANLRRKGLNEVLKDLWSIGYNAEWHIISARAIGACHLRERIWIIAWPDENGLEQRLPIQTRDKRKGLQFGRDGEKRATANTDGSKLRDQPGRRSWPDGKGKAFAREHGENEQSTNTDNFRLWKPFATTQAQQIWWAETTASLGNWKEVKPPICGMDDGLPGRLDKPRKERIKQLGNSVHPDIPELIGKEIMRYEGLI